MALTAATNFEVRTTGSDSNGGGFDASFGGTDYSQQNAAQATGTVTSAGTTVTATTGIFTAAMKGNLITDGTTWKQITAFTSATQVTVDSAPSWTSASVSVGGALASPAKAFSIAAVDGQIVYIKATATYTITGNALAPSAFPNAIAVVGYGSARGDGTRAVFSASGMTAGQNCMTVGDHVAIWNIEVQNPKNDAFFGPSNSQSQCYNCKCSGFANQGFESIEICVGCFAGTSSSGYGFFNCKVVADCVCQGTQTGGFYANGVTSCMVNCVADSCVGVGYLLGAGHFQNCVAYGNGGDGFNVASSICSLINIIAYGNGGFGFNNRNTTAPEAGYFRSCAAGSNTSGNVSGGNAATDFALIALSASPFNNAAGHDFSLNSAAGGGAACRAAGFPGALPNGTTTGYIDVGAVQHQDAGAGTAYYPKTQNIFMAPGEEW